MTLQTQSSTYSNYSPFPSEPDNQFRAIKGEVLTDVEPNWMTVDASYQIGFAGSIASVRLGVDLGITDDGKIQFTEGLAALESAKADLEFMHQNWLDFYTAAKSALDEVPTEL